MVGLKYLVFSMLFFLCLITPIEALSLLNFEIPSPTNIAVDTTQAYFDKTHDGLGSDLWLTPGDYLPYAGFAQTSEILLYLSSNGDVDSVGILSKAGAEFIKGVRNSLMQIRFTPALYEGERRASLLAAELLFTVQNKRAYAILRLPFLAYNDHRNKRLIDQTLILNGFGLPGVKRFPPYYCSAKLSDRSDYYNFAIYEMTLDSLGKPVQILEHCSSNIDYSKLFSLALLHAEFQPAYFHGRTVPSNMFITVRFFPQLEYPTHDWPPIDAGPEAYPFEYVRLESALYLDSIIHPAIPLNIPGGVINWPDFISLADSVYANVKIDTLGRIVRQSFLISHGGEMEPLVGQILKSLHFLPARDINNAVRIFDGLLILRFQNSRNIRIEANWLPPEAQPECRITN